jgi:seryl-tRNA synthetase
MLDPRTLATRRDEIVLSCQRRGVAADVDAAAAAQERVTTLQTELNESNRRRNEHQKAGKGQLSPAEREAHVTLGRRLKEEVAAIEAQLGEAQTALQDHLAVIPNFVHPDSPIGGEEDFNILREVGEPPRFEFASLDHLALGEKLDLFDFEAGAKVAGQKFCYFKNDAVLLELALQRYALDAVTAEGFTPYVTPDLARSTVVDAMAFSPRGPETQIYSISNAGLDLIGTAEITLGGLYLDALVDESELPIRLAGISHCYRTEAGSAGRESKGLYRVHQFTKVEMFALTRPEDSEAMHEEILSIEEKIFQGLEIPYRVVDVATGDLGAPAYRKFDIEAWMPGRGDAGDYGEVTSTSNCTDFQARRLRARFRRAGTKRNELLHTLNGTAVAVTRTLIPLLENHQRPDGSVAIPKALQPYVGRESIDPR